MKSNINFSYLIFLSVVAALGGFLFGYDTAVISGTTSQVTSVFGLDTLQQGWYVGCALIGSIAGVLMSGLLSDKLGRKLTMILSAVMFSVSAIGCAFCADFNQLVVYRIIGGVGIGVVSVVSPLYISEVSVAQYRGRLVSLYQLAVTVGFLGAYLMNYQLLAWSESAVSGADGGWVNLIFVNEVWRGMLGMETIPALLFFLIIFFIPESPRWLIVQGKEQRAQGILERIYLSVSEATYQLQETRSMIASSAQSDWRMLLQPGIRKAVLLVRYCHFRTIHGGECLLYYGAFHFENAGLSGVILLFYQVMIGLVNTLTTILALIIIDKVGRKKLVYYGVSGMVVSLCCIAFYFAFGDVLADSFLGITVFLFGLCVLLCCIHLCSYFCAAERNVSNKDSRVGHVHCRFCFVDWYLSHRAS